MSSYNVSFDKAVKLIGCVRPKITFVNGIFGNRSDELAEAFKLDGFNVISLQSIYARLASSVTEIDDDTIRKSVVRVIGTYISKFTDMVPTVVIGFIKDVTLIDEIFANRMFTYAYLYPNNAKRYRDRVLATADMIDTSFSFPRDEIADVSSLRATRGVSSLREQNKDTNSLIKKLLKINSEIYQTHLEAFEGRLLTILT